MQQIVNFLHLVGIIIALGSVIVIDMHGFLARKSKEWSYNTIEAHHVTKPLIWIGTILLTITWFFMYNGSYLANVKTGIIIVLILNGIFLSTYVSKKLDEQRGKKKLFPMSLQYKTMVGFVISFLGWWSLVYITVLML